jgi:hypothetical protein
MKISLLKFVIIYSLFTIHYSLFAQCGEQRWDVKTLSDKDTVLIDFDNIVKTTVSEQVSLPKPDKIHKKMPRLSSETTVYSLDCYVIGFKREKDMDIHIVIKDMNLNQTMVAELPSPYCPEVDSTSHAKEYIKVNNWFLKNIGKPTGKFHNLPQPISVTITGVGFFDFVHGQNGMATNGREIHPILSMDLLNKRKPSKDHH